MCNKDLKNIIAELNKEIVINLIKSNQKGKELRLTLTVPEVAKLLRLNNIKIYELVRAGKIPHFRDGNRIVIPITSFVEWLDQSAWDKTA